MKRYVCTGCLEIRDSEVMPPQKESYTHNHTWALMDDVDLDEPAVLLVESQRDWLMDRFVIAGYGEEEFYKTVAHDLEQGRYLRVRSLHPLWEFLSGVIDRALHGDKDSEARSEKGYAQRIIERMKRQWLEEAV